MSEKMTDTAKIRIVWADSDVAEHVAVRQITQSIDWCEVIILDSFVAVQKYIRNERVDGIVAMRTLNDACADELFSNAQKIPVIVLYKNEEAHEAYKSVENGAKAVIAYDNGPYIRTACAVMRKTLSETHEVHRYDMLEDTLQKINEAVCITESDMTVVYVNHEFCRLFECTEVDIIGKKSHILHDGVSRSEEPDSIYAGYHTRSNGGGFYFSLAGSLYRRPGRAHDLQIWVIRDMTAEKEKESLIRTLNSEIERSVTVDSVTGVYNRRYFMEQLTRELVRANRYGTPMSLILVDIDSFGRINDEYGHIVGDHVLTMVSDTVAESIRVSDVVGRLGSNAFGIILPQTACDEASHIAETLRMEIMEDVHFGIDMNVFNVTCSVGIVELHSSMERTIDLMTAADKALKEAKARGKNCVVAASCSSKDNFAFTAVTDDCDR